LFKIKISSCYITRYKWRLHKREKEALVILQEGIKLKSIIQFKRKSKVALYTWVQRKKKLTSPMSKNTKDKLLIGPTKNKTIFNIFISPLKLGVYMFLIPSLKNRVLN